MPALPRRLALLSLIAALAACGDTAPPAAAGAPAAELTAIEALGKAAFFDPRLSLHGNQSCAVCHGPQVGWTGDLSAVNAGSGVYEGSVPGAFGNRKPPAAAYAMAPVLGSVEEDGARVFAGGHFWDGRATGERLGDPMAEQAQGPFLNPVEQALPDSGCVVWRVCTAPYGAALDAMRRGACGIEWPADIAAVCAQPSGTLALSAEHREQSDRAYDDIARAIAAYERSKEVNPFSSKFDRYRAGTATLTDVERMGLQLFEGRGKCAQCHPLEPTPDGRPPLLTDFTFDNLGVPRNPDNPWYRDLTRNPAGAAWVDEGLGGFLATRPEWRALADENLGKHKVPTVRNVDRRPDPAFVKAFMHNGYFKTLEGLVHFYNTRDVKPVCPQPLPEREALAQGCWPAPEIAANINREELGDLGLTPQEEAALVAFMRTLSDEGPPVVVPPPAEAAPRP